MNIIYYLPLILIFLASIISIKYRSSGYILSAISSIIFIVFTYKTFDYLTYFYLIAGIVWIITSIYSLSYGKNYGKWLAPLFILTIAGMMTILYANNFFVFIAGWEIMSVPAYLTVAINKKNDIEDYVFMFFSEISTILIIVSAILSYYYTGSLTFNKINNDYVLLIFTLGAMSKMGLTPFMISEWLPIAHGSAPANSSAIFSATMTLMGVYGITKLALLSPVSEIIGVLFMAIGIISVMFGALYAYISENMKSLGGFSTIENNGTLLSAIGLYVAINNNILRTFVLISILIFAMAHSIAKTGLFLTIGNTGTEYFSGVSENNGILNQVGKFFILSSLSGLFPGLGGLGTWMILESFFMGAFLQGTIGISSIIGGSLLAMGEGFATAAMFKVYYFTDNRNNKKNKNSLETYTIFSTGALLVFLFLISFLLIGKEYISGIPNVLIFNGFMIESRFSSVDFGLLSPLYIAFIILIFTLLAYIIFGKPKTRSVKRWNTGIENNEIYNSFIYSSNIRLMLKKILKTHSGKNELETVDVFWYFMIRTASSYRKLTKYISYKIMNSSISTYMIYMIIAFISIIVIVSLY